MFFFFLIFFFFVYRNKLNVRQAIDFISNSCNEVTDITIQNCWRKMGILPDTNEIEMPDANKIEMELEYQDTDNNLDDDEVADIIANLSFSIDSEASKIAQTIERL